MTLLARVSLLAAMVCISSHGCREARTQQGCRMGNEAVIARTGEAANAVALVSIGDDQSMVIWSADGEVWWANLDEEGVRVGEPRRIERLGNFAAGRPDGADGVKTFWPSREGASFTAVELAALAPVDGMVHLAMLERPDGGRAGGVFVAAIHVADPEQTTVLRVGNTGAYANSVALAARKGAILVAWHEGAPNESSVRLASVDRGTMSLVAADDVERGSATSGAAIVAGEDGVLVAWSATVHGKDDVRSEIRVAPLLEGVRVGKPVTVAGCSFLDPTPFLFATREGYGLVFRDERDDDGRTEFYFLPLGLDGKAEAPIARISRADGYRGPMVVQGEEHLYSAVIRSFQRNLLVGLNRFDGRGVKAGGEFQIYADKSDFVRVALVARGDEVLLTYAEDRPGAGRILTGKVTCEGR